MPSTPDVWSAGDYREVALTMLPAAAHLVRLARVAPGERVLDLACGTGIVAITARRAGARVTGLDITPALLAHAREDAALAGYDDIRFDEGDAEALPYADRAFDVVLSGFGMVYAPRADVAAREMLRVLRPGGRLALTAWPAEHVHGAAEAALAPHLPPRPPDAPPSPMLWADPNVARARLYGAGATDVFFERGVLRKPALSLQHYWRFLERHAPPVVLALRAVGDDPARRAAMRDDLLRALSRYYRDNEVHQDYVAVLASKADPLR